MAVDKIPPDTLGNFWDTDASNQLTINWNEDDTANRTLNIKVHGTNRNLDLNEDFTIGDGHGGTLTYSTASKTLTIEDNSVINQDLSSDASPTFAGLTLTTGSGDPFIKAWIQFNGTGTIAIQDSFNVTSITDNGTGEYSVTWDTDFANDDYSAVGSCGHYHTFGPDNIAVGSCRIQTLDNNHANVDEDIISVIAIGDQ